MTDTEALSQVIRVIDPAGGSMRMVKRNGSLLLSFPENRDAARRTLQLYQPQRRAARVLARILEWMIETGCHRWMLPRYSNSLKRSVTVPAMPEIIEGSCGVMLGNPEHRVRRAIASFKTSSGWEVAKVAFGSGAKEVIRGEVEALKSLPERTPGAPEVLDVHQGKDISLMRVPYVRGTVIQQGESSDAIDLLEKWISNLPFKPLTEFPEWPFIESALSGHPTARHQLERLSQLDLKPVVRHGDFTRWNLLRMKDGNLMAVDWEWGVAEGMPGIDLVHYFAQDARLVHRLAPAEVANSVTRSLESEDCRAYLERTGWSGKIELAILASIAFTVGAKQQANEAVLVAVLASME